MDSELGLFPWKDFDHDQPLSRPSRKYAPRQVQITGRSRLKLSYGRAGNVMLKSSEWPELSFPEEEARALRNAYSRANVILEYGSGGSTVLAANMSGKFVVSVESDRRWAQRLQSHIDAENTASPAIVYHADIGPTGDWGRPLDDAYWPRFHIYPLAIWSQPFFRHPDVVLIDGRFRTACFITVLARITRPVIVLFDDYRERKPYHTVEQWVEPHQMVGRMALFDVRPGLVEVNDIASFNEALAQVTYSKRKTFYDLSAVEANRQRIEDRFHEVETLKSENRQLEMDLSEQQAQIIYLNSQKYQLEQNISECRKRIKKTIKWSVLVGAPVILLLSPIILCFLAVKQIKESVFSKLR